MKLDKVRLEGLRFTEGFQDTMNELKQLFEQRINLTEYSDYVQPVKIQLSPIMRICLMVGLSDPAERDLTVANSLQIAKNTCLKLAQILKSKAFSILSAHTGLF